MGVKRTFSHESENRVSGSLKNNVLSKIFEPTTREMTEECRKLHAYESSYIQLYIIRVNNSRSTTLSGHATHGDMRNTYKIFAENSDRKGPFSRLRSEGNILMDLRK
jgi:hypothetical protein